MESEARPFDTFVCDDGRCFYLPRMDHGGSRIDMSAISVARLLRDQAPEDRFGSFHGHAPLGDPLRIRRFRRVWQQESPVHMYREIPDGE